MLNFKRKTTLPINIQMFAEPNNGDDNNDGDQNTNNHSGQGSQGNVFSAEYVGALRSESAGHRTRAVKAEDTLRKIFGLKDGEALGDLDSRLTAYQTDEQNKLNEAQSKVNERLINSALDSLEGYDNKLVKKLIERSEITVGDDGKVDFKSALEKLCKEYPSVKQTGTPAYAANTGSSSMGSGKYSSEDAKMRRIMGLKID